jgi:LysR family hydrogen peroxide-inducible transcriptional activator
VAFRPTHRQLQYFVTLADLGHFGAAAKACHVSQPTLSAQLKLLEEQLGVALIERGTATAHPTPAGLALLPLARQVLANLDEIVATAQVGAGNLGGLIRLGVAPTVGPYVMPRMLPHLHGLYPNLEIYIREDRPPALESGLADGLLDCILTPMPLAGKKFEPYAICSEKVFLGVPADSPIAKLKKVTVDALSGQRLLTLGKGHKLYDQVQDLCDFSGAKMREDYEGTSLDALRQMVSIGMGLSLFPATYVASEFSHEANVVLCEIEGWPIQRTICLAWRQDSVRREHFQALAREAGRGFAGIIDDKSIQILGDISD